MFPPQYGTVYQQPYQKPYDALIRVTGIEAAKAYQMPPNSTAVLFDANDDIMYVKSSDAAGFPTIRQFKFEPYTPEQPKKLTTEEYVTRKEFEDLKEMVRNGKQFVRNKPNVTPNTAE